MTAERRMKSVAGLLTALLLAGCNSTDERIVEIATRSAERQAKQNEQMAELQQQVAEGVKNLSAADADARREWAGLNREAQTTLAEVGRQRDALESERRELAARRQHDPMIAEAIAQMGFIIACLLPLMVAAYAMVASRRDADGGMVADLLLDEIARRPLPKLIDSPKQLTCKESE